MKKIILTLTTLGLILGQANPRNQLNERSAVMGGVDSESPFKLATVQGSNSQSSCPSTFTDSRDGQAYKTFKIGEQCWMAEHMRFTPNEGNYWDVGEFGTKWTAKSPSKERLYDWYAAQKICPNGWRLPSTKDFADLRQGVEDAGSSWESLKTKSLGGKGLGGFNAFPAGLLKSYTRQFANWGDNAYLWTNSKQSEFVAITHWDGMRSAFGDPDAGLSVRCLQGEAPVAKASPAVKSETVSTQNKVEQKNSCPKEFHDSRNNKDYRALELGSSCWMAQNLNYRDEDRSVCFNNEESNCDQYGRLYTWKGASTACPDGWRLPTDQEWTDLEVSQGIPEEMATEKGDRGNIAGKLKAVNFGGTNQSGFSVLGSGVLADREFLKKGQLTLFWTKTEETHPLTAETVYSIRAFRENSASIAKDASQNSGTIALSVRCVMKNFGNR